MITERIKCAILGHEWRYYDFEHSKCERCGKIVDYFEEVYDGDAVRGRS